MIKVIFNNKEEAVSAVKRMFFLAYQACGSPVGMGFLKAIDNATEEQVWENICTAGDYSFTRKVNIENSGRIDIDADYVFGRMVKFFCFLENNIMEIPDRPFHPEYQGFYDSYSDNMSLINATLESLNIKNVVIENE